MQYWTLPYDYFSLDSVPGEVWKPSPIYPDSYEVSNMGRVKSLGRVRTFSRGGTQVYKSKILRPRKKNIRHCISRYFSIKLCKEGQQTVIGIHRLVGFTFVTGFKDGYEINHKDYNPSNNQASNLEWMSRRDNMNYSYERIRAAVSSAIKRIRGKRIAQYSLDGEFINSYETIREAGEQTNINAGNITSALKHRLHQAGGYKWEYSK